MVDSPDSNGEMDDSPNDIVGGDAVRQQSPKKNRIKRRHIELVSLA
jgi:hypothetical protein